jgi:cobalt/nickel transport system ATP-binding protein
MKPLIQVRGLRFRYPNGVEALCGVDFDLRQGECVILLGANGSGKTTFLLHLNGLLRGSGSIEVCGEPLRDSALASIRRRVGLVFQNADDQIFSPSVIEDVAFGPLNHGHTPAEAAAAARKALRQVGLEKMEDRAPHHLSGGEKRRVAIAGVLAMEPEILVLDEPTTALDPPGQSELIRLLNHLPQAKIISTNDAGFARAVGTRAVFFENGRIVDEDAVHRLIERRQWETAQIRPAPADKPGG